MDNTNQVAIELVDEVFDFIGELGIKGYKLDSGATVIDFSVDANGGVEMGMLLVEIQIAGLVMVQTRMGGVAGTPRPHVELSTDRPALALLCSQKADWEFTLDDFDGLGPGPACMLAGEGEELHHLDYYDEFDLTILAVESINLPAGEVVEHVAETTGLESSAVFLPTYAAGSLVGSITGATRATELVMFNSSETGYDPTNVLSINGSAPLAPVGYDESVAMDRVSDAVAYGGHVHVTVSEDFDGLDRTISTAEPDCDIPFEQLSEDVDWGFGAVDPDVLGPAQVTIDVVGDPTYTLGETNEDMFADSFGL